MHEIEIEGKKWLNLPAKRKINGSDFALPYVSHSQIESFSSAKGFNTGLPGYMEYVHTRLLRIKYQDSGWGVFGEDVENYICYKELGDLDRQKANAKILKENAWKNPRSLKDSFDSFSEEEREVLDVIQPLGTYQDTFYADMGGFYLMCIIDDMKSDGSHIRDYKTCSDSSSKKYYKRGAADQIFLYAYAYELAKGKMPTYVEYFLIKRKGGSFGKINSREDFSIDFDSDKITDCIRYSTEDDPTRKIIAEAALKARKTAIKIARVNTAFQLLKSLDN